MVSRKFERKDVQGNILRGYNIHYVRYAMLEVRDAQAARDFLGKAADGGGQDIPAITTEEDWGVKPKYCFNIGLTKSGLTALGLSDKNLSTFPKEFLEGMPSRAIKLGDIGRASPEHWEAPFNTPDHIHIIASIHSEDKGQLDEVEAQLAKVFNVLGVKDGRNLAHSKVIFGYTDSISQPKLKGINDPERLHDDEPVDPLGIILLGYPTHLQGIRYALPTPEDKLGFNGSFNAFRVLEQDAAGFENFLTEAAEFVMKDKNGEALLPKGGEKKIGPNLTRKDAIREIIAAQIVGRWRNGVPYENSPDTPHPKPKVSLTNFDYSYTSRCPVGAHMRRCNPRGGPIVQRVANWTRRLIRRGMTYGPDFDPKNPDNKERGLLGNFLCANLGAQFEAVMYDWLNLGLQHPDITGSNDPLLGANNPETSWFDLQLKNGEKIRLRGLPRFVTPRGGAYTFLPSMTAIRYLAGLRS